MLDRDLDKTGGEVPGWEDSGMATGKVRWGAWESYAFQDGYDDENGALRLGRIQFRTPQEAFSDDQ